MKKLLSMLLSLTTLLGLLPAAALAAEPAEISGAEVTVVQEGLGSVYDVLPASYGLSGLSVVESTEFSWDAETGRGYYYQLDENSKLVYDAILASGLKDGPTDAMVSIAGLSNTWNQSFNITVTDEWSLADKADQDMVSAWVTSVTTPALLALIYDHPELSWLVNTTTKLSYGGATTDTVYDNTTCISNYTVQQISVGKEVINDYGDLNALITVVNDMTDAIDQKIGTAATTYQRIGAIHDDICELVTYTTDADLEKDLYQTVYSALVDGSHATVCVGYAKAFKMLCDAYQIPCVLVSGDVDGDPQKPHMWNYVLMEDGDWYAVDCTWDDTENPAAPYQDCFLAGKNTVSTHFADNKAFSLSHVESGVWSDSAPTAAFKYPALNATAYAPPVPDLPGTVTITPAGVITPNKELTATFAYTGTETAPEVAYQWYKEEVAISDATEAAYTPAEVGTYKVEVSAGGYQPISATVNVEALAVKSIAVTTQPAKTTYFVGETFNTTGMVVTAAWNDGNSTTVAYNDAGLTVSDPDMTTAGTKTVTVTYGGAAATFTAEVKGDEIKSIAVTAEPTNKTYTALGTFDTAGMVITATYDSGKTAVVDAAGYEVVYTNGDCLQGSDAFVTIRLKADPAIATTVTGLTVKKIEVSLNTLTWQDSQNGKISIPYDGQPHHGVLTDVPDTLNVTYTDYPFVGTHTAAVTVEAKDPANYETIGVVPVLYLTITPVDQNVTITPTANLTKGGLTLNLNTLVNGDVKGDVTFELGTAPAGTTLTDGILTSGDVTGDATVTVKIDAKDINGDGEDEYDACQAAITVAITNKTVHENALTVTMDSWTYGEAAKSVGWSIPPVAGTTVTKQYAGGTGYNSDSVPTDAGSYTVTVFCENATDIYSGTASFTIYRRELSITDLTATNRGYAAGNQSVALVGGALSNVVDGDDVACEMPATGTMTDANAGTGKAVSVTKPTLTGTTAANYTLADLPAITVTIHRIDPAYTVPAGLTAAYGQTLADVTLPAGWTWKDAASASVGNVGDHTFTVVFTPADTTNYNAVEESVTVTVGKADWTNKTASTSARYGTAAAFSLAGLLPEDFRDAQIQLNDTKGIFDGTPTLDGTSLTYKLVNDAAKKELTGEIKITVNSGNYNTFTFALTVTATVNDKLTPVVTASDITMTYNGRQVPASMIRGTATCGGVAVPGTWSMGTAAFPTDVKDSGTCPVLFTPADPDTYMTATATITVTITKADPTGAPGYTAINTSGKMLKDAALTEGTLSPAGGELKWTDGGTTAVNVNAAYEWVYTPADMGNYNELRGTITPWVRHSSGGSSSSDKETVKNPDGSTATTVTDRKTGTVTETTKDTDGTVTTVETKKDGTVTETVKTPEGVTGTVVTNKHGTVTEVEASVSNKAAKDGETVTLPVEVPCVSDPGGAPGIAISVPKSVDKVTVEIPVDDVTSGTVAVIVDEYGNEKIVPTSVITGDGVALTLGGSATVKIVDNSKAFADIPSGHFWEDAINFVSSRELFNGKTANTFVPNDPATRAQLMAVLARLDGESGANLHKGMAWAVEMGISDGSNPSGTITRQQLAAMLYRYAGSPAAYTDLSCFPDAGGVSSYAQAAMQWAVENGILSGTAQGDLNPQGLATRAHVAAMIQRFVEHQA